MQLSLHTLICEVNLLTVRRRGRSKRSAVETFLEAIKGREKEENAEANTKAGMKADEGKVVRLDLRLTPRQTRHRRRVIRIQPATTYLQHDVDYKVQQCGIICGAIEESSTSLEAIDERVFIN